MTETTSVPVVKKTFRLGFSFGVFSFLLSPLILFQGVLLFLFLLALKSQANDDIPALSDNSFLILLAKLLFFSILLLILFNLAVSFLGIIFDKRKIFSVMAFMLTFVAMVLVFIAPKLIDLQSQVTGFL